MFQFWVVGGEYSDTHFYEAIGGNEQWVGPFTTYEAAQQEWSKRAWGTVDDAHIRYRIERIDPDIPPPATD
jgi:hypothetical protein